MRAKILSFTFIIAVVFSFFPTLIPQVIAASPAPPSVRAKSALMMNLDSETILLSQNTTESIDPAGLVKLMTGVLAIENIKDLESIVTVSESAIQGLDGLTTSIFVPGEQMTARDMLYCALLYSSADACNALAEASAGSIDSFVAMMNDKAKELGMDDTHFVSRINKYFHFISYMTRPDEVIYLFSDITETFNTHQALDRSEKILRNIYDNLPAGIELYDKNGFLIDLNTKDMEIFGIANKETVLGVNLFENPNLPLHIIEALRRKEAITFRIKYPFSTIKNYYSSKKNGLLEIYTTATELYDSQGNLINYLLINIDNTEITQVYSQLAEFESSFSMVSKIGYCRFDIWTRTGYGIPQWYYNLGEEATTPLSEIIGVYKHVHPEDRDYILKSIQQVKAGVIESFFKDLRITTAEGNKWTRINVIRNTMNDDPQKLDMICVNYDVTELKETEQRLIEAKERAEESDRLKSAFLANMSHEIRTPLNAIVGFSDLLAESDDREERFGYLKIVQENNELLLQLISDILDLSKIEAGTFKFINDRVNVYQLCNEIVRSYSIKIKNHQVKLIFDEQSPVYYITSDKNRVIQVLSNFINNALKFTSQGTITLGYELLPNHELKLYVCDTGQGIAEEKQKVIFDRFVKLNTFVQGTGLGLSICKSLVKQMGGQIGVNSKEGEGSCFWFTHPISLTQTEKKRNNPEN